MARGRRRSGNHLRVAGRRGDDLPVAPPRAPYPRPPPGNLPLEMSTFVGREREMAEVEGLLADTRLLTLTGPGGCGKTRLALRVAREAAKDFADGAWWVGLASLADPDLVLQAAASALGVREQPGRSLTETLSDLLEPKEALLVLDNCEHLIEACATLAEALLRTCPDLRVLATSREALGIAGERAWPVPSLSMPDLHRPPALESLADYESVRLFCERAEAVRPAFAPTAENILTVARVCHELDGIPLAIELAAVRVKVLTVEQIASRLEDSLGLLTVGSRTALPRHRTLRATIDWSHKLLSQKEQALFRMLSAFSGGFTLEAAEEVGSGEGLERRDVLDVLSRLVDKSLVVVGGSDEEARYRMLQTVRQYALERLDESGEEEEVRGRHAGFFLALAEEAEPELRGPRQVAWMKRLGAENDNLRAALRWLLSKAEWEMVARLGWALWLFWWLPGRFTEGQRWMEEALEKGGVAMPVSARAKVLFVAGMMAGGQDDHRTAEPRFEESLRLFEDLEDKRGAAFALAGASLVAIGQGRIEDALAFLEKSGNLYMEVGDKWGTAVVLSISAVVWLGLGDHGRAERVAERCLELSREIGDEAGAVATALYILASLAHAAGDNERARGMFGEMVEISSQFGDLSNVADCLEGLASVAASEGGMERAARLWGAAEALREETMTLADAFAPVRSLNQGRIDAARATLGEAAFAAAWAEGRAMTPEEAVAYALLEESQESPARSAGGLLSTREIEVLGLVAEGLTDAEIARRLHLSPRTIGGHLRSAYRKLGVRGRTAAVRRTNELGLI